MNEVGLELIKNFFIYLSVTHTHTQIIIIVIRVTSLKSTLFCKKLSIIVKFIVGKCSISDKREH